MEKQSSDTTAALAGKILGDDFPLTDEKADEIITAVMDAMRTGTIDKARYALREHLAPIFQDAKSLAGSVVSQADGPE